LFLCSPPVAQPCALDLPVSHTNRLVDPCIAPGCAMTGVDTAGAKRLKCFFFALWRAGACRGLNVRRCRLWSGDDAASVAVARGPARAHIPSSTSTSEAGLYAMDLYHGCYALVSQSVNGTCTLRTMLCGSMQPGVLSKQITPVSMVAHSAESR
jgi:hypothetical protein